MFLNILNYLFNFLIIFDAILKNMYAKIIFNYKNIILAQTNINFLRTNIKSA
jgi:hypothetical protein